MLSQSDWMAANFETTPEGWIVYKRVGRTPYHAPDRWVIAPGSELTEVCNPTRTNECACGVNFGTLEWCKKNYTDAILWRCLIRYADGPGIVVPYNTDGKARCEKLVLLEVIK